MKKFVVYVDDGPGRFVIARDAEGVRAAFSSYDAAEIWAINTCREPYYIEEED